LGQSLILRIADGSTVNVSVERITGEQVRLGIQAPESVRITRAEIEGIQQRSDDADKA
jgi:carbon storage regulator CsrA